VIYFKTSIIDEGFFNLNVKQFFVLKLEHHLIIEIVIISNELQLKELNVLFYNHLFFKYLILK